MKISLCITNHNQNDLVKQTIDILEYQYQKPEYIFVCSDDKPFKSKDPKVICINNEKLKGRCENRNSVIQEFLDTDSDALVFIDGDSYPKEKDFLIKYEDLFEKYDLVFGTREHTSPKGLKKPASDLLTANMDNLWLKKPLDNSDLRVVSNAVESWQNAKSFNEKLDLMITGMIGWSCNFGFTRKGLIKHIKFMEKHYGKKEIFDSTAFNGNWGYEDVAMGIDALYAGLNIWISDDMKIVHQAHERSDGLFDHVKGRHLIMERVRNLAKATTIKDKTYKSMIILFGIYIIGVITGLVTMAITLQ
jgi:hypothetical protein